MPRISLWKNGEHSKDYKFIDARIREMFTAGGTGVNVHKYLGPIQQTENDNPGQPNYTNQSEQNIQDLLFLENRDRKYDPDIYQLRGVYQVADLDFDLTQFGLFLTSDTMFMVFHINDMVEILGRKLMSGDVIELPHRKDYYALDSDIPAALKRYYVIQDCTTAAEGYSVTWWPHLWRTKCTPLVDSQEYKDILNNIKAGNGNNNGGNSTLGSILSQYDKTIAINDAIVDEATQGVPKYGYDTNSIYVLPTKEDGSLENFQIDTTDTTEFDASNTQNTVDNVPNTPTKDISGYLTGDGQAPDGWNVTSGTAFPDNPTIGDYALRLDMMPNRLFRFDGRRWVKVEDNVRGTMFDTQNGKFFMNSDTLQVDSGTMDSRQGLSKALARKK